MWRLRTLVKRHNYKRLNFTHWHIRSLKKLGRNYLYKFKKSPKKRKLYKRTAGFFKKIMSTISYRRSARYFYKKELHNILEDYYNLPNYKLFFFKQAAKNYIKQLRNTKYYRKKIIVRRVLASKLGVRSNAKFYHIHKTLRKPYSRILNWITKIDLNLVNLVFNLGWARSIQQARFMVDSGAVLLNGGFFHSTRKSHIRLSDNLSIPKWRLKRFKYLQFYKFYSGAFSFIDWYKSLRLPWWRRKKTLISYQRNLAMNYSRVLYKKFWNTRTFEWKFAMAEKLRSLSSFKRWDSTNVKLFDFSRKKVSISFSRHFNFHNFLSIYKSKPFMANKNLCDFFLNSHYF